MGMKALDTLRDTLCEELDEIARKGEMSAGDLETVHKLTDTIKNIDKICILEEEGEYSQAGDWEARGSYDTGDSYARRGMHYVRGHYSRDGGRGGRMGGGRGGNRGGYSHAASGDHMVMQLENMLSNAETEREREAIKQCIEEVKGY